MSNQPSQPHQPYPSGPSHPPGSPAPSAPGDLTTKPGKRRSAAAISLTIVTVLLMVAVAGTEGWWFVTAKNRHDQLTRLADAHRQHQASMAKQKADLAASYSAADLPGKMTKVRNADSTFLTALLMYHKDTDSTRSGFYHIIMLQQDCLAQVLEYNRTAAKFSDEIRGDQPAQVDMTDHTSNCSITGR